MTYFKQYPSFSVVTAAILMGCASVAGAQTIPDAGRLLPQQPAMPVPARPAPEVDTRPQRLPAATGPTVVVRRFVLTGRSLVSEEELAADLAAYLNRPLSFDGLETAAEAVALAYRRAGWVVRTFLPKQEIKDGQVTIEIVEARFGGAVLEPSADLRASREHAVAMVEAAMPLGQPVQVDAMDRVLLLLGDVPGLQAAGHLVAGQQPGQSDLSLRLSNAEPLTGQIDIDNTGSRSTGSMRTTAQTQFHGLLGKGDRASVQVALTEGSEFLEAGMTVPAGFRGARIGFKASQLRYRLVAPEFLQLGSRGTSDNLGLELTHPLVRHRAYGVNLSSNLDLRSFDNQSLSNTLSHYGTQVLTLGANAYAFDGVLGGGTSSLQAQLAGGRVDLSGSPNASQDAASTRTSGRFAKLRVALSRQQTFTTDLSGTFNLSGQVASKNLDSSEKFYLGGSAGVRAYPSSEGGGSEGVMANIELRHRLSDGLALSGFYDWGQVHVLRNPSLTSSSGTSAINRFNLKGGGLTLTWQPDPRAQMSVTWARRVGVNPSPTSSGMDQDGTLELDRLWARMRLIF